MRIKKKGLSDQSSEQLGQEVRSNGIEQISEEEFKVKNHSLKSNTFRNPIYVTEHDAGQPFVIARLDNARLSSGGPNSSEYWLTLLVDSSENVLAFNLSLETPSYRSTLMVMRECVKRFERLPRIVVMDSGLDSNDKYLQGFLGRYGVICEIQPFSKPRFNLEKYFVSVSQELAHKLPGYIQNTRAYMPAEISNYNNIPRLNLSEVYEVCKGYFYESYNTNLQPNESKFTGEKAFRRIAYDEEFLINVLPPAPRGIAKVNLQRGIKVGSLYYYSEEFRELEICGTNVPVRFDPWDIRYVYAYVKKGWVKCYSLVHSMIVDESEEEIRFKSEEIRAELKMAKKQVLGNLKVLKKK